MGAVVGQSVDRRPETREGAGERTGRKGDPRLAVIPQGGDPFEHRVHGARVERRAARCQAPFVDADDLEPAGFEGRAARLVEQAPDVVEHLATVGCVGWQTVHDDHERQPALSHPAEHVPRHAIRVSGGGRDEDAQVGRLDQPVGDGPVCVLDRIDVGRVDHSESRRGRGIGDRFDLPGVEAGQRALGEGRPVVGTREDDGLPGRRAQHARGTQCAAGDRVEQRALAGAGRPQEEDDERRLETACPDSEVAREVIAQLGRALDGRAPGWSERQAPSDEVFEPPDDRGKDSRRRGGRHRRMVIHLGRVVQAHPRGCGTEPAATIASVADSASVSPLPRLWKRKVGRCSRNANPVSHRRQLGRPIVVVGHEVSHLGRQTRSPR